MVTNVKSGLLVATEPLAKAVSAGISFETATIGERPVSGCEAWAVLPVSRNFTPREAQQAGPAITATCPKATPGILWIAKA